MQRRVAAVYFVFFLVLGASAYSVISVAQEPTVNVEGDTYSQGDTVTVDGQEYNVSKLTTEEETDHGETTISYTGELTYTNESFQHTAELENGSNVSYQDGTYQVQVPNGSNVSEFTLRQQFNVSQRLQEDPNVENQTLSSDGTTYVRYRNGTTQPLEEYLPEPQSEQFSTGDTLQYQNNSTTVDSIEGSTVTLTWTAPSEQTIELSEGDNVTLGDQQHFAHFEGQGDNTRVVLAPTDSAYESYSAQQQNIEYFHERINGLWGVVILSALAAIVVVSLAYMPVRG